MIIMAFIFWLAFAYMPYNDLELRITNFKKNEIINDTIYKVVYVNTDPIDRYYKIITKNCIKGYPLIVKERHNITENIVGYTLSKAKNSSNLTIENPKNKINISLIDLSSIKTRELFKKSLIEIFGIIMTLIITYFYFMNSKK